MLEADINFFVNSNFSNLFYEKIKNVKVICVKPFKIIFMLKSQFYPFAQNLLKFHPIFQPIVSFFYSFNYVIFLKVYNSVEILIQIIIYGFYFGCKFVDQSIIIFNRIIQTFLKMF